MSDARRSERRSSRLAKRKPPPGAGRKPTGAGRRANYKWLGSRDIAYSDGRLVPHNHMR